MSNTVLVYIRNRLDALRLAPAVAALRNSPQLDCHLCSVFHPREDSRQILACAGVSPDTEINLSQLNEEEQVTQLEKELKQLAKTTASKLLLTSGSNASALTLIHACKKRGTQIALICPSLQNQDFQPSPSLTHYREQAATHADLLLTPDEPTAAYDRNLAGQAHIAVIGSLAQQSQLDARATLQANPELPEELERQLPYIAPGQKLLVVATTPELQPPEIETLCREIEAVLATKHWHVIFPVELEQAFQQAMYTRLPTHEHLHLMEPPPYLQAIHLAARADAILTTSPAVMEMAQPSGTRILGLGPGIADKLTAPPPPAPTLNQQTGATQQLTRVIEQAVAASPR